MLDLYTSPRPIEGNTLENGRYSVKKYNDKGKNGYEKLFWLYSIQVKANSEGIKSNI